jgi:ankyrin repeat protein
MIPEKWKWLFQPLNRTMRSRLELGFGVVVTGASMVLLSTVILPDPSRLAQPIDASVIPVPQVAAAVDRVSAAQLRLERAPVTKVAPDFARAVVHADLDAMERLYSPGMPLDGMLAIAAELGERPVALWLLDHGADVHEDEGSVDAPVLLADEHPEVVALLLERGATEPWLATAAEAIALNAVLRLLAAHAPVNPTDSSSSPLRSAVASSRGTVENKGLIIEKLLSAGADPNADDGESVLAAAVRTCDSSHDDPPRANDDCVPLIKLLVKHGARTKGDAIAAALYLAYRDEPKGDVPLDAVLAARVEPGATAFALAQAVSVSPRALKKIVAKGVDWAWHDGEDDAALPVLVAAQRGDRDFVRALLDAGAPVDVHFKDAKCALGEAIDGTANSGSADHARLVELLVARGADVNRRLPDGRTPLFAAAESGDLRAINALLGRGARVNDHVLDDTALDAAEQHGNQAAARVLHAHGARRALH